MTRARNVAGVAITAFVLTACYGTSASDTFSSDINVDGNTSDTATTQDTSDTTP